MAKLNKQTKRWNNLFIQGVSLEKILIEKALKSLWLIRDISISQKMERDPRVSLMTSHKITPWIS